MSQSIKTLLINAQADLASISESPRLDAELLLAAVLEVERSYLHAWPERIPTPQQYKRYTEFLVQRNAGTPIAYILGHKEFWSLMLKITPDILIPRPETELLVETVLADFADHDELNVADLGTGSGAIALALAFERPSWQLTATDSSAKALAVAKDNATRLKIPNIAFFLGDWCLALPHQHYDVIVSNPPYIAENDPHLAALHYEPLTALIAGADGLDAIRVIISSVLEFMRSGSWLYLEHGYEQAMAVSEIYAQHGFEKIECINDLGGQSRLHRGCFKGL